MAGCLERFGRVDALVNNAGTSAIRALDELTDEDWQAQWELNVMGPMRLMRAAAPEMAGRGWGRIVNVCSSSGKRPSRTNMAYSVTKAAELSLSRAFADCTRPRACWSTRSPRGRGQRAVDCRPAGWPTRPRRRRGSRRDEALARTAERNLLGALPRPRGDRRA